MGLESDPTISVASLSKAATRDTNPNPDPDPNINPNDDLNSDIDPNPNYATGGRENGQVAECVVRGGSQISHNGEAGLSFRGKPN